MCFLTYGERRGRREGGGEGGCGCVPEEALVRMKGKGERHVG